MPILTKPTDTTKGQISDLILSEVEQRYGFGKAFFVLPIVPMNGKLVVLNAKSETTRKAVLSYSNEQFLLKQVPWYCSNKLFVEFMVAFQSHLYKQDFPVPELIATKDGDFFTEIHGEFYYLQRFVSGNIYSQQQQEIFESGALLGRLHKISNTYSASINITPYDCFRESSFHLAVSMIEVLEEIIRSNTNRLPDGYDQILLSHCHKVKLMSLQFETNVNSEYFDHILQVHGDYNPLNLMYNPNNRVAYTFDFENTALDNPAHDVAEGLLDFCFHIYRPYSTRFERLPAALNYASAYLFLDGYRAANRPAFQRIARFLPAVVGSTLIELVTLGIVRGDYNFEHMQDLPMLANQLVADTSYVIDGLKS